MTQEYISQVSKEIERRVLRKLPEEFSGTESRVLGALSKLDEFLLNPQVRTFSVAVPGTSRKSSSENREPTGDRFLGNPCPKEVFSTYHSCNLNDPEQEETHHNFRFFISAHIYNVEGKSSSQRKENQRVFFYVYFTGRRF